MEYGVLTYRAWVRLSSLGMLRRTAFASDWDRARGQDCIPDQAVQSMRSRLHMQAIGDKHEVQKEKVSGLTRKAGGR